MGKIIQSRRWVIVAVCCAFAVLLNLGLTTFGARFSVTFCDDHVELKRGPAAEAIIPMGNSIADTMCRGPMTSSERTLHPRALFTEYGVFARGHIPRTFALVAGVVIPLMLVISAAFLALRQKQSVPSTVGIMIFGALGLFTASAVISVAVINLASLPLGYWINFLWPMVIPIAFFSGAYWLWRTGSSRERA